MGDVVKMRRPRAWRLCGTEFPDGPTDIHDALEGMRASVGDEGIELLVELLAKGGWEAGTLTCSVGCQHISCSGTAVRKLPALRYVRR